MNIYINWWNKSSCSGIRVNIRPGNIGLGAKLKAGYLMTGFLYQIRDIVIVERAEIKKEEFSYIWNKLTELL